MLTIFPDLLVYSVFGPFLIRVALALILFIIAKRALGLHDQIVMVWNGYRLPLSALAPRGISVVASVAGIFILLGLYTQVAAMIALGVFIWVFTLRAPNSGLGKSDNLFYPSEVVLGLMLVCVALMLIGAGAPAIDLPL